MITARTLTSGLSRRRAWYQGTGGGSATGRTAGRHREQARRQPSLLVLDYPPDNEPIRFRATTAAPFYQARGNRLAGRRAIGVGATVTLAFVVAAGVLGGFALLSSPGPSHGGIAATPGVPLPALAPAPSAGSSTTPAQISTHSHRAARKRPASGTAPGSVVQVPALRASSGATAHGPAIAVRYVVDSIWSSGFQAQVEVTNNSSSPIVDWQIAIALYGDIVTSVKNASGFFGNSILLLQPGVNGQVVGAHGGTLSVTFVAEGLRTTPVACAFNGIPCG